MDNGQLTIENGCGIVFKVFVEHKTPVFYAFKQ
jgi:hypothetical protein